MLGVGRSTPTSFFSSRRIGSRRETSSPTSIRNGRRASLLRTPLQAQWAGNDDPGARQLELAHLSSDRRHPMRTRASDPTSPQVVANPNDSSASHRCFLVCRDEYAVMSTHDEL